MATITPQRGVAPPPPPPAGMDVLIDSVRGLNQVVRQLNSSTSRQAEMQRMFIDRTGKRLDAVAEAMSRTAEAFGAAALGDGAGASGGTRKGKTVQPEEVVSRLQGRKGKAPEPVYERMRGGMGKVETTESILARAEAAGKSMSPEEAEQHFRDQALEQYAEAKGAPLTAIRRSFFSAAAERITATQPGSRIGQAGRNAALGIADRGFKQGIMSALPAGALRYAGIAGAVVGGAQVIGGQLEGARRAALPFQQAMGVSGIQAQAERGRQQLFRLRTFGTMSSDESEELYRGVTRLGLTGAERDEGLDFALGTYRKFGMAISESVKLIELSTRRSDIALGSLREGLEGVTDAAREAGVNADTARKNFVGLVQSASETIAGPGVAGLASAVAQAEIPFQRQFPNLDLGGLVFSQQAMDMAASRLGMHSQDVRAELGQGNYEMARRVAASNEALLRQSVQGQFTQAGQGAVRRFVAEHTNEQGEFTATQRDWQDFAQEHATTEFVGDARAIQSAISGITGTQVSSAEAVQLGYQAVTETLGVEEQIAETERSMKQKGGGLRASLLADGIIDQSIPDDASTMIGALRRHLEDMGAPRNLISAYIAGVVRTGTRNPVAEKAMASASQFEEEFKVGPGKVKSSMVEVKVGGERRVVTAEEAFSFYADQIQSGDARAVTGEDRGRAFTDIFGSGGEVDVTSDTSTEGRDRGAKSEEFEATAESLRKATEGEGGGTTRVIIEPSEYFRVNVLGEGAEVVWGQKHALPPRDGT